MTIYKSEKSDRNKKIIANNNITIMDYSSATKKILLSRNSIYQFCLAYSGLFIQIVILSSPPNWYLDEFDIDVW